MEHIADRAGCRRVIHLACGHAKRITPWSSRFQLVGIDSARNIKRCKRRLRLGEWIVADIATSPLFLESRSGLAESIAVCREGLSDLPNPEYLLTTLRGLLEDVPYAVLATRNRDLTHVRSNSRKSGDAARWNLEELGHLLESADLETMFMGFTVGNSRDLQKNAMVAVVQKPQPRRIPPPDFRVSAIIHAYNEGDIITSTLEHLIAQGVEVDLVDHWSTDETPEIARRYVGRGVRTVTRFPAEGPKGTHDAYGRLQHVEAMAQESDADWILRIDADEIRESPWQGISLREALYRVDQAGFNAIDHTVLDFHPTDEPEVDSLRVQDRMRYFEFGARPGHFRQIRGWKRQSTPVEIAWSGGHEVRFPGRRIFPFKFLLRHYPIRSQEHGEKKIHVDRLPRITRLDNKRIRGWHTHYEAMAIRQSFIREPARLLRFDDETFYRDYVVERLSGVGIIR